MTGLVGTLLFGTLLSCALAAAPPAHEPDYTVRLSVVLDAAATPPVAFTSTYFPASQSWQPLSASTT